MGLVVVGVDNSAGGKAALRFALEEAQLRQSTLRVVHAWRFGYIGATGLEGNPPVVGGELDEFRATAAAELDAIVADVANGAARVQIEKRVDQGSAAAVLVDESRHADLLVVGSRGRGGFASLLLGSVSQQCADHAACPVVIVRDLGQAAQEEGA